MLTPVKGKKDARSAELASVSSGGCLLTKEIVSAT
jgi:hypothetical protein